MAAALAASLPARLLGDLAAVPLLRPADPLSAALDLSSQRGGAAGCARLLCAGMAAVAHWPLGG